MSEGRDPVSGKIFILSGPSGSGKTTLYQKLLANRAIRGRLAKTISVTTRLKRPGERHGRDYFFVQRGVFLRKKRAGQFLESEEIFGSYYGTLRKQVQDFLRAGRHVLLTIDVKGARAVCRQFPQVVRIFVKAPSLQILKDRLEERGSDANAAVVDRLQRAHLELKEARHYDYLVVNDDLKKAVGRLTGIVLKEMGARDTP